MKFNISAEKFLDSLVKLNFVVPSASHSTLPILSNIFFELSGNKLRMVSTDLESFLLTSIEVEGIEDGTVAVPAKKILDLVKALIIKTESISAASKLDADLYERLSADNRVSEIFSGKLKYNSDSGMISYTGLYPLEDREKTEETAKKIKAELDNEGNTELIAEFLKLETALTKLFDSAEKLFQKNAERIKIKVESNDKNKITVISKNGKYNFFGEPVEDYPLPEDRTDLSKIKIKGSILKRFLHKVKHSVKYDEIRRNMSGVFFDIGKSELRLVATDGFRLSKITTGNLVLNSEKDESFIVPLKTCEHLLRLLTEENVSLEYDNTMIKVIMDKVILYSKLIDDTFPNYETVIPKDNDKRLKVSRFDLQGALRRASIFTDQVTKRVKFEIKTDSMYIKADNPEIGGEGEEIINCDFDTINGETVKETFIIAFNVMYLLDCLTQIESDKITITFSTPSKASIAYPDYKTDEEEYLELIMPVRVG